MDTHYRQVVSAVQRVRWVQRVVGLLEGVLVFLAGVIACGLVLTLLAEPLSTHAASRSAGLALCLALPMLAALAWWLRTPSLRQGLGQCALAIERACGHAHNEVINALELGRDAMDSSASVSAVSAGLVAQLVRRVGERLPRAPTLQSVDSTRLRRLLVVVLAVAIAGDLAWLAAPEAFQQAWVGLLRPWDHIVGVAARTRRQGERPSVGDIRLTYHYPLYTGLPEKVVVNSTGHIAALKGTEVWIRASANARLTGAHLVLSTGQCAPLRLSHSQDSQDDITALAGRIVVVEDGTYRFRLLPQDAEPVLCPEVYAISVGADAAPEVEITDDAGTDSSNPAKVAARGEVEVAYRASDDFGLGRIRLAFRRGDKQTAVGLKRFASSHKRYSDTYKWDLAALELTPGERLAYRVEAEDTDSVTGPNVGRSRTHYLEVFSARRKHQDIVEIEDRLKKAMLHLLAHQLESPATVAEDARRAERLLMAQENTRSQREAVLRLMADIAGLMRQDSLSNYAYFQAIENMASRLRRLASQRDLALAVLRRALALPGAVSQAAAKVADVQEDEIRELELDLIFLADIVQQQRLDQVRAKADDLLSLQRNIVDTLEHLASHPDPAAEAQARALLEQIQRMLAEMMAQMAKMAPQLPQEFANADAQTDAAKRDMAQALKRMMEAMDRGDMKAALQAAQQLMQQLSKVMDSWRQGARSYGESRYGKQLQQLQQMHRELGELEQRQHQIAQQTNAIKREAQRRVLQLMKHKLEAFFKKQLERLAKIEQALAELKQAALADPEVARYQSVFRAYAEQMASQSKMFARVEAAKEPAQREALMRAMHDAREQMRDLAKAVSRRPVLRVLAEASRKLAPRLDLVDKLRRTLEAWDAGESLPLAEQLETQTHDWSRRLQAARADSPGNDSDTARAEQALQPMETAGKASYEIAEDLRQLAARLEASRQQSLTEAEAQELEELAAEQGKVRQRTQALQQRAEQAAATMPFMSPKAGRRLAGAAASMQHAGQKLRSSQLGQALAHERDAAAQLSQAKQMIEDARQMCQQGMMAGSMAMPTRLRRPGPGARPDLQKVEIPSEDAYKVPKRFRQEIIDAVRKGMPERFEQINKEYYRKLLE